MLIHSVLLVKEGSQGVSDCPTGAIPPSRKCLSQSRLDGTIEGFNGTLVSGCPWPTSVVYCFPKDLLEIRTNKLWTVNDLKYVKI